MRPAHVLLFILLLFAPVLLLPRRSAGQQVPFKDKAANLALGRTVRYWPTPDYPLTRRGDTDAADLTDGVLSDRQAMWFESNVVGWKRYSTIWMMIDFDKPTPLGRLALHTQSGGSGRRFTVRAPRTVRVLVGNNGTDWAEQATWTKSKAIEAGTLKKETGEHRNVWIELPLGVSARYVLVEVAPQSYPMCIDEMAVLKPAPNKAVQQLDETPIKNYGPSGLKAYAHKPLSVVPQKYVCYEHMGLLADFEKPTSATLSIRVPAWVDVARIGTPAGHYDAWAKKPVGDAPAPTVERTENDTTYTFKLDNLTRKSTGKTRLKFYWRAPAGTDGQTGTLRMTCSWEDGKTVTEQPLVARAVPEVNHDDPAVRELIVLHGRLYPQTIDAWPDFVNSYRGLGFNTAMLRHPRADQVKMLKDAGMKIQLWINPWHYDKDVPRDQYFCQYPGKAPKGKKAGTHCPAYRGKLYQDELARVAKLCATHKLDYVFFDFEAWAWDGPEVEQCTRCRARKQELGIETWDDYKVQMGIEMWTQLHGRIVEAVKKAGGRPPQFLFYDVAEAEPYQRVWDFQKLNRLGLTYATPSLYCAIDDAAAGQIQQRLTDYADRLGWGTLVPWLSPGDVGEYDSDNLEELLLWCYRKGIPGVQYWSERHWAGDDFIAQARAVRRYSEQKSKGLKD